MPVLPTPGTENALRLVEMFSSVQGEGILIGCRQVFIRLAGCNLTCGYCDTPVETPDFCRVEAVCGSGRFSHLANPVPRGTVLDLLQQWHLDAPKLHHSISVTGGEPLGQVEVLRHWLPALRDIMPICLETNGTLPSAFALVKDCVDFVSMDIKLPSSTGCKGHWEEHNDFLAEAAGLEGQAKMVVDDTTSDDELDIAGRMVASKMPEWPIVLQPVTVSGRPTIESKRVLQMQKVLSRVHGDVRIIPQTHPLLGIL